MAKIVIIVMACVLLSLTGGNAFAECYIVNGSGSSEVDGLYREWQMCANMDPDLAGISVMSYSKSGTLYRIGYRGCHGIPPAVDKQAGWIIATEQPSGNYVGCGLFTHNGPTNPYYVRNDAYYPYPSWPIAPETGWIPKPGHCLDLDDGGGPCPEPTVTLYAPAPTAIQASSVQKTSFRANWAAAAQCPATGYVLDVATDDSFTNFVPGYQDLDVSNVTSYSVNGLPPNTTYFYRVRGYYSYTETVSSNVIAVSLEVTDSYKLSATVTPEGRGSVSFDPSGGTYLDGTTVTLTATPADQYWEFSAWSGDLGGALNPASLVIDFPKSVTATFSLKDTDEDGISDQDEDSGPNGGDANGDGIPDSQQGNVAVLKTYDGKSSVVVESSSGTTLGNCRCVSNPAPNSDPYWVTFPYGFFEFVIEGVGVGGAATVKLSLPQGSAPDVYYKYGATPTNNSDHWYRFNYDTTTKTGAEFRYNVVTLHFVDGALGDDDLTADGRIVDIGAPGFAESGGGTSDGGPTSQSTITSGGSTGSVGGCFIDSLLE